ncbi:hypothetical protein BU23DRAFT_77350 [Bimuria novae-zelandiae CBS 107.79]|uniref:Uncharacterized protein n=1 Tax=Bimuria novae-zelandiae CBS 107.79 TaxID=1447943 RepID=A0A6A5UJD9_9PLEO|nr:hypothetical protein BU23DRAFT_77350 [Bimuria novae-zelandiae CBS 107.79]
MANLKFELRSSHSNPRLRFEPKTYCDHSDGATFCACQRHLEDHKECMFYGRAVKPLAFSISKDSIVTQAGCLFFTRLPREIRQMIWEHALTDTTSAPASGTSKWRSSLYYPELPGSDIAFSLLQTCKAVYLETYRLPVQRNSFKAYDLQGATRPDLKRVAPWQAALIQRLDISLRQTAIEGGELRNWLTHWYAKRRHEGAWIAPLYRGVINPATGHHMQPFPFDTLSTDGKDDAQDGDEVTLPVADALFYGKKDGPTRFSARAMRARPLTHLTLRMCRQDWWNWNEDLHPDPEKPDLKPAELSLDPAVGVVGGSAWARCSVELMEQLAEKRRAGEVVQGHGTWGAIVGRLPDLKELTLVLEMFEVKLEQLERVVECAKTWRFPLEDTLFELVWDGEVEVASWESEPEDDGNQGKTPKWHEVCTRNEVRIVRFVRGK